MSENQESTQATQQQPNPTLTLSLSLQHVNIILAALQEMPFKAADPVIKSLVPQAEEQLKTLQGEETPAV